MSEWIDAILFGVALVAFTLGLSSIVMGFMSSKEGSEALHERIEMGYLGVSGLVVCLVLGYLIVQPRKPNKKARYFKCRAFFMKPGSYLNDPSPFSVSKLTAPTTPSQYVTVMTSITILVFSIFVTALS